MENCLSFLNKVYVKYHQKYHFIEILYMSFQSFTFLPWSTTIRRLLNDLLKKGQRRSEHEMDLNYQRPYYLPWIRFSRKDHYNSRFINFLTVHLWIFYKKKIHSSGKAVSCFSLTRFWDTKWKQSDYSLIWRLVPCSCCKQQPLIWTVIINPYWGKLTKGRISPVIRDHFPRITLSSMLWI